MKYKEIIKKIFLLTAVISIGVYLLYEVIASWFLNPINNWYELVVVFIVIDIPVSLLLRFLELKLSRFPGWLSKAVSIFGLTVILTFIGSSVLRIIYVYFLVI